ncbi:piggyBac transposable element-derived protein 4-like [Uloborus diversus]|uniref:piggyBac transposable element-derived protein 4-like n=1 Tax=Uloborus diversus TaxID=327109 RepID=UPI00240A9732|nr:piggyBac transposable element-derived protein 4-like [Uloborus diversus]
MISLNLWRTVWKKRPLSEKEQLVLLEDSDSDEVTSEVSDADFFPSDSPLNSESSSDSDSSDGNNQLFTSSSGSPKYMFSKNKKIEWRDTPYAGHGRTSSANIIKLNPGQTSYATSRATDVKSSFLLYFTPTIGKIIIDMTNVEGAKIFGDKWQKIDYNDLHCYLGLLILAGVFKSHGEALTSLWSEEFGRPIFRAAMSLKRFKVISRVLRFDNKNTRAERRLSDKMAAIREWWDTWVEVLPKLYNPGNHVTIDEHLVGFRGRCPFRQYMPKKTSKYGIKIWIVCNSKSAYAWNVLLYTGKPKDGPPEKNQASRVVLAITYGLSGHNVTFDNWFSFYELSQLLLKRKVTMLGTIRKNKPELPIEFTHSKGKEVHTTIFGFTTDTTLVAYTPKKNICITLISTMHNKGDISNRSDRKTTMILDYNSTKGAVDTLDQIVATYTCKRGTTQWPVVLFYNIIDVSAYNAFVVWREINLSYHENKKNRRRYFVEELGYELIKPSLHNRKFLPRTEAAAAIVKKSQIDPTEDSNMNRCKTNAKKRGRCNFCPRELDRKYSDKSHKCLKVTCKNHFYQVCNSCK